MNVLNILNVTELTVVCHNEAPNVMKCEPEFR